MFSNSAAAAQPWITAGTQQNSDAVRPFLLLGESSSDAGINKWVRMLCRAEIDAAAQSRQPSEHHTAEAWLS